MNELALFSGVGGGILGGKLLGWRTVCAVEWDEYASSVLVARQNDKVLPPFPIWDDVQTFDGRPWKGIVDVVSGGFPCQDISIAGNGKGLDGERSGLWGEMSRIVGEVRPRFVFVENSPMLVVRGLDRVLADLTQMGYDCRWGIISASDVGAPHKRERIWIVAHTKYCGYSDTLEGEYGKEIQISGEHRQERSGGGMSSGTSELVRGRKAHKLCDEGDVSNPERMGREKRSNEQGTNGIGETSDNASYAHQALCADSPEWWSTEPLVGRVAHGVADRVDRLKAIGNGQVPLCAATAWRVLTSSF